MINNQASAPNEETHAESTRPRKNQKIGIEDSEWPKAEVIEEISRFGRCITCSVAGELVDKQAKGLPTTRARALRP